MSIAKQTEPKYQKKGIGVSDWRALAKLTLVTRHNKKILSVLKFKLILTRILVKVADERSKSSVFNLDLKEICNSRGYLSKLYFSNKSADENVQEKILLSVLNDDVEEQDLWICRFKFI